jgi:LPS O-antigen subunit length determinant protein (WzzB/FepE family)
MNIAELKLKFFRQIDGLDKDKLEEAYGVLLNYINSKDDLDEWNNLTVEQQKGIIDSVEQLEDNQGISHKNVMNKYKNKYNA